MNYSRLKLTVQEPLKLKDLSYKFVVINYSTQKKTNFEGRFDEQGLTEWYEIHNSNTLLIYEILFRGELLQRVSAKAYPDQKKHSTYILKVTTAITKNVKENVKEIYLEDGVVGWYLVKQKETMLDWSKRIFKKPLVASDWDTLRANNPHLKNIVPIKILTPGQVIILSNTTTSKKLEEYKVQAQKAESKLDIFLKDPKFDPLYFANTYDQLQDIKKQSDIVGITNEQIRADFSELFEQNLQSDPFVYAAKESVDSMINFNSHVNKDVAGKYTALLKKMDEAKQNKAPESFRRNFYLFENANAKEFEALKTAASNRFFSWNHGIDFKNNRDMIRRTVFVRSKKFNSIDDYIKNMDETSKVSRSLKWGGRLVFAWDVYNSAEVVADAYKTGDSESTRKEIIKQTGKINGGLIGARVGGSIGTAIGGVVIGVAGGTVGLPILVVVGLIAVGSTLIGGYVGGVTGEAVVEYGYERLK